jgi:predicted glutamine amidotransferase
MCLIIKTDTPKQLSLQLLETAYNNNSDGFGLMFCNKGKLHTQKIVPKTFKDIEKLWSKYNDLDIPMGLHFRFNTNGDTTRSMSHPFQILSKAKGDDRDMWVMHNGPMLPTPMIDDNKSDTHQFIKWVLRPQLSANPKLLYNAEWQEMIEELIGSDKLLFLDGKTKEFVIYNEDEGKEVDNIGWLSNTYSIQPTSYGLRNYTYDFETNKMAWKTNSWWDKKDDDPYHYSGLLDKPKDNSKIDLSGYSTETHYDNEGNVTHTTHTPNKHNNGARFTSYPKNTITVNDNENSMYNGKKLDWQDICYLDNEELLEVCEENPIGIAKYIQEIILGGKYDYA